MVYYSFSCSDCGDFTEWHQSMQGNKERSACPTCKLMAKRIFTPPMLSQMDSRLKKTIEGGMEPKIMTGEAFANKPKRRRSTENLRPWQAARLD